MYKFFCLLVRCFLTYGRKLHTLLQSCIDNLSNQMLVKGVRILPQQKWLVSAQCAWELLQSKSNKLFNIFFFLLK